MRAGLFPGQGIDAKVVHKALDPQEPRVQRASDLLGYDLVKRVEQVARRVRGVLPTAIAQPAILTAGVIAYEKRVEAGESFDILMGHSLGEYTALVAAGAIPFGHGLKLVAARGRAMHRAAQDSPGGMAAVLGLDIAVVEEIASRHGLTVANDNSPVQVVVSGDTEALAPAAESVREAGGRCVLLPVEGPFHSAAMESAVEELTEALLVTDIRSPSIPVMSNVTARPYRAPGEIRKVLLEQLMGRVRFRESLLFLAERGVTEFVDLGPGRIVEKLAESTIGKEAVLA